MEVYDEIMSLNDDAKVAYLQAFTKLAHADGVFDAKEKKFIENMAKDYMLPKKRLPEVFNASDDNVIAAVKNIKSRRAALELIKDLCFLGYADKDLSEKELVFIGKIGEAMGVDPAKVEEISDWVVEKMILTEKARIIFDEV
ncbi:MAG: TerB family tellurite resistance protein [Alphaproteobacteria bacterium]|nr:TerB family tellurite resistance protein [Alphaproteobacteria bacterium]